LPPVTKKYDPKIAANTNIADGIFTHGGFFNFKLGHSKTENGILYSDSIFVEDFEVEDWATDKIEFIFINFH
jgi:hypothetical protein